MKNLQQKHKEWCDKNFGWREPQTSPDCMLGVANVVDSVAQLAHRALKSYQGIRDEFDIHAKLFGNTKGLALRRIESLEGPSREEKSKANPVLPPLLGVIEEVGELLRSTLYLNNKEYQIDAVGDIVLYLLDYCNKTGIDFEDAVRQTAEKVYKRDWVANPVNGEV